MQFHFNLLCLLSVVVSGAVLENSTEPSQKNGNQYLEQLVRENRENGYSNTLTKGESDVCTISDQQDCN
eukprot:Pgem_evm1s7548